MPARIDFSRREIVISPPRPVPSLTQRSALHRELDAALDALAEEDAKPAELQGPGRLADQDDAV